MVFEKIPVLVYTAKNGYDWQGLDGSEDGATKASLDKALGAAGKTAGAWGAVVRRPVASRRWAEWPRSRLCWVLFRFHPDAGRDQRGRACNYTAAACIPVGEKLPKLDFAKIFAAPEMEEVRTDGYAEMAIDLDGADYVLRETEGGREGAGPEPSWDATWAVPELRREDALGTLSRWCQDMAVDRGDLKAVLREEAEGGGVLAAHMTYAVFPQVAALRAAEETYAAAAGQGGGAALRDALSGWRKALVAVEDFNRALGGLEGLGRLVEERSRAWEEATGAAEAAERTARERAAAAASAAASADELSRAIARYRVSADAEYGKEDNRRRLDELERMLAAARARHGERGRWNELEAKIDNLRQWTGIVEGDMDTVRTYRDAAERGGAGLAGLEAQARTALEQVRGLSQAGLGGGVSDALREMERLFGIAQAQKAPPKPMAPTAANDGNVPPRAGKPVLPPASDGDRVEEASRPYGNGRARDGGGHGQRGGWTRWWARWWEVVACVATLLAIAATLGGIWGAMRRNALKEWSDIRASACNQAKMGQYSGALATMATLPPHKLLLLKRSRLGTELREGWAALAGVEGELREEMQREKNSRGQLYKLERQRLDWYRDRRIAAPEEWEAYEMARAGAARIWASLAIGDDGLPVRGEAEPAMKPGELSDLPARYAEVAQGWEEASRHLVAAFRKIDATSAAAFRRAEQEAAEAKARQEKERKLGILKGIAGELQAARAAEEDAKQQLEALEAEKNVRKLGQIGTNHARSEWKRYEDYRKAAEEGTRGIRFDAEVPYREKGGKTMALRDDEINNLPAAYRVAAESWGRAKDAFETACQTVEKELGRELEEQRARLDAVKTKLLRLESDRRYDAVQRDASAQGDWIAYNKARQQAMELPKGACFDVDGQSLKIQVPLADLPETIESCQKGEQLLAEACGKLEEAYRKLDEREEVDDMPAEDGETGAMTSTSTDGEVEGDKPAEVAVPATVGGRDGAPPATAKDKERGRGSWWRRRGDGEPTPETQQKEGGKSVPGPKASGAESASAASPAAAVAVPAEASAQVAVEGVAVAEKAASQVRKDAEAGTTSAGSKEDAE